MTRAERAPITALGRRTVGLLDDVVGRLDRLTALVEDLVVMVGSELAMRGASPALPDESLPVLTDGACPQCGGTRITIPEDPSRQSIRRCSRCGFSWRAQGHERERVDRGAQGDAESIGGLSTGLYGEARMNGTLSDSERPLT